MTPYALYRIIPFATFMACIAGEELLRALGKKGLIAFPNDLFLYLYPLRAITVGLLLILFWKRYDEIRFRDLLNYRNTLLSIGVGIVVFIFWINMPWTLGVSGEPIGYNPTTVSENFTRIFLIAIRLLGAAVVVPIMEELFWRSFLLRYLITPDITRVPVSAFSWTSLIVGSVLFGLEHAQIYAGITAGVLYASLLYRTKSITSCIISHACTNALLGVYVLCYKQWHFW